MRTASLYTKDFKIPKATFIESIPGPGPKLETRGASAPRAAVGSSLEPCH